MSTPKIFIGAAAFLVIAGVAIGLSMSARPPRDMNMPVASSSSQAAAPAASPQDANSVMIANYKFAPTPIKVKQGTTVTWTNSDTARHNIVADDGQPAGGPSGPLFGKGETYKFTFNTVGTFKYHCEPHPYMHGSVEVTP